MAKSSIDWRSGHRGPVLDDVGALVAELGPVQALYRLEEAEKLTRDAAAEASEKGLHDTATALTASAWRLRGQQFQLVERFA